MADPRTHVDTRTGPPPVGWCCSYCSQPLEGQPHGLLCRAEERWFATEGGIHRLLSEERRREIQPFVELDQRARRDESRVEPPRGGGPEDPRRRREARFEEGLSRVAPRLPAGPWNVLQVGAGDCWASVRLLERGHLAVAVDVNLDPENGLAAADRLLPSGASLPRAEAEMEALPLEPGSFDWVLAMDSLHASPHLIRTLVELRRVTRRGGLLLVVGSPVYRRRPDGEARVADRMRELGRRYRMTIVRESQPGYLVLGELEGAFRSAGWSLEPPGWPGPLREGLGDTLARFRSGRAAARYPILIALRDG